MLGLLPDILFPSRCAGCGDPVSRESHSLCRSCAERITIIDNACPVCSAPQDGPRCRLCADRHWYITKNITISEYAGTVKNLICKMKFGKIRALYAALGSLALHGLVRNAIEADVITWVPMNGRKQWERGFNQSELISRFISKKTGIPCRRLLREKRGAGTQRKLGLRDRFIHSLGRYEAVGSGIRDVKNALIVDDVCTTGATLNECARQLRLSGVERVFSLTIARTDIKRLEKF
ncbi:MAG TPA: ComF family protein [Spirochaetota bacterium]|nr:ComF family protein [Spirochaetota bacterium]HPL15720.1 ComF family protein [Spirochaetota bacterium]HQJ70148.1 ComF family protein [Spirochaetota bacterium]HRS77366.1 ComF family protein [Spirochaetota bacterium]HRT74503.1 ComF family protein [Spirochaetota bacterium]